MPLCSPPYGVFGKSHELTSHKLTICPYWSGWKAGFLVLILPLFHCHFIRLVFFASRFEPFGFLFHVNFSRSADRFLQLISVLISISAITISCSIVLVFSSFPWLLLSLRFLYYVTLFFAGFGMTFVRISIHGPMSRLVFQMTQLFIYSAAVGGFTVARLHWDLNGGPFWSKFISLFYN